MNSGGSCAECGAVIPADSPGGFCLQCLFKLGLAKAGADAEAGGQEKNTAVASPRTEQPGDRVGRYRLLEEIGRGGCGVVYMAEQEEPVRRKVALKVIKLGMDTRQVVARFEAERQALALMDHPNIARVLDAGATDSGRPYFVMELVGGTRITDYCDQHQFTTSQRLDLFVQVCHAVQHAHQKGIIHRDLKPSNVLVATHDGLPVPKVIDFGIAKATQGRLTDQTVFTAFEQFLGTPAYMSPEQAQAGGLDVDTRSDIYSLGVLLYELLTGKTPFDTKALLAAGLDELCRTIREVEPAKPSTRLTQERLAAGKSEIRNPKSEIDKDLDCIVMKALEKDRARRYESSTAFAQDIQRFLHEEPVVARPPSTTYRTLKFVRKHRAAVLVAGLFIVGLVTATIVSTALALWARREQERAERATTQATLNERKALDAAKAARESEEEARTVLGFFKGKVLAAASPKDQKGGLGWNVTLREALDSAEPSIANVFTNRPLIEAEIREALGLSYHRLGLNTNSVRQHERALELRKTRLGLDHPATLTSMNDLAQTYGDLGRHTEAMKLHEETLAIRKTKLGPDHLHTLTSMNNLALSYAATGRHTEALKLQEETLALAKLKLGPDHPHTATSMNNLAASYARLGRHTEALKLHEETLTLKKTKLGPHHPDTLVTMMNLATSYYALGRHAEALKLNEETLALSKVKLGPDHPRTLTSMDNLATSYARLGRHTEALKLSEETLALTKAKFGPDHPDTLTSMDNLASSYAAFGRHTEALKLREEALAVQKTKLGPHHPDTLTSMNDLASSYYALGKHAEAMRLFEETLALQKTKLGPDHPDTLSSMNDLAASYYALGKHAEAMRLFEETLALMKTKLGPDHPKTLKTMYNLANTYVALGRRDDAIKLHEEALATRRTKLGLDHPDTVDSLRQVASAYLLTKRFTDAETLLREFSVAQRKGLPSSGPALADTLDLLIRCLLQQDKHAQATEVLQECVAIYTNRNGDGWPLFKARMRLGKALLGQQKFSEAETELLQGYDGLKQRQDKIPARDRARYLNEAAAALVQLYTEWGKPAQAEEWRKKLPESGNAQTAVAPEPK